MNIIAKILCVIFVCVYLSHFYPRNFGHSYENWIFSYTKSITTNIYFDIIRTFIWQLSKIKEILINRIKTHKQDICIFYAH